MKKESGGGDRLLFSNVASEWMKEKESYLKQSTICRYRNNLNLHLLPAYGDRLVTDITRDDVDAFVTRLCASDGNNGKGLSGNTARSVVSVLKTVVEYARDYRRVPVANLNGIFIKNQGRPIRVFSRNEQKMIEDYLHENMDLDNDLIGIMLCLYTGIRLGELCALRWEDVLLDEGSCISTRPCCGSRPRIIRITGRRSLLRCPRAEAPCGGFRCRPICTSCCRK